MNRLTIGRSISVLSLLLIVLNIGCQQQPALEGSEIPVADMPNREATYDDIIFSPGGPIYRANGHQEGEVSTWQPIKSTTIALGNGSNDPQVGYRNYIETKAGEIRYNIIMVWRPNGKTAEKFIIRIDNNLSDIQVRNVGDWNGAPVVPTATILMLEIPQNIQAGDYKLEFIISVDGHYYGKIPCTIHVTD
jgi:hypothetical protein